MNLVKVTGEVIERYSIAQLKADNPNTSFPVTNGEIPLTVLASFNVYPFEEVKPYADHLTEELSETGFTVVDGVYRQNYEVVRIDITMARDNVRAERNKRLAATDWRCLQDTNATPEILEYRQLLRDISEQASFPFNIEWPAEPQDQLP